MSPEFQFSLLCCIKVQSDDQKVVYGNLVFCSTEILSSVFLAKKRELFNSCILKISLLFYKGSKKLK